MKRVRSPIEIMVDRACGYDPNKGKTPITLDKETNALLEVADAAVKWWMDRRPVKFTEEQHLNNPTINIPTENGKKLALSAANLVKLGWKP